MKTWDVNDKKILRKKEWEKFVRKSNKKRMRKNK